MNTENKYLAIEGEASSWEQAISICGEKLCKSGYVEIRFTQDCIEREKEYPTGLCSDIPVAIPHCKSKAILKNGICYLRLKNPVVFRRMDDDEQTINTRNVFAIAIKSSDDHLRFLQQMMVLITDTESVQSIESMNIEDIPAFLEATLEARG